MITKKVRVGNITIGGNSPIVIQSMTNTKTSNVKATLNQISQLHKNGAQLVRVAILDINDSKAFKQVVSKACCPIIADIHYNPNFAIQAIKDGAAKIRINPGNISNKKQIEEIIKVANKYKCAIRIGINSGSLPKGVKNTTSNIVNEAIKWIKFFESHKFTNLVVSLKSSNPIQTRNLYLLASKKIKYPLHLGVTEAGNLIDSSIKTAIGLSELIQKGIGNTIRVSISGDPLLEPIIAKKILAFNGIKQNIANVIACPTCGRCIYNFDKVFNTLSNYIDKNPKPITIAIMGCPVNGLGECKHANIGIYGTSKNKCALFKDGKLIKEFFDKEIIDQFIKIYKSY